MNFTLFYTWRMDIRKIAIEPRSQWYVQKDTLKPSGRMQFPAVLEQALSSFDI